MTTRKAAMVAGIAIVTMTLAAVVATDIAIGPLVIADAPAATFDNIAGAPIMLRLGLLSWMVVLISDIFAAWGLYMYYKPINKELSLISAWLRIVYTAILGAAILNYVDILQLNNMGDQILGYELAYLESQTWLLLNQFEAEWSVGLLVFGLHIFLLGYLGLKSAYIPKLLSISLIIGAVGYLMINAFKILIPEQEDLLAVLQWIFILPMLAEVALGLWLLVKGKDIELKSYNS